MSVEDRVIATENKKRHDELCRLVKADSPALMRIARYLFELETLEVYSQSHRTFAAFVAEELGFEKSHAYRLIDAAKVEANLSPIGENITKPQTESQYREVAKAPPEKQVEVVRKAAEVAAKENRKPTAKDYKKVVGELVFDDMDDPKPEEKPEKPPLSKAEQITAERKKARSYAEYLQRSVDDLNRIKPNKTAHSDAIKWCGRILGGLEQW